MSTIAPPASYVCRFTAEPDNFGHCEVWYFQKQGATHNGITLIEKVTQDVGEATTFVTESDALQVLVDAKHPKGWTTSVKPLL